MATFFYVGLLSFCWTLRGGCWSGHSPLPSKYNTLHTERRGRPPSPIYPLLLRSVSHNLFGYIWPMGFVLLFVFLLSSRISSCIFQIDFAKTQFCQKYIGNGMEFHICSSPRSFDLSTRLILFRKIGCHGHYGMLNHHKTISTQRGEIPNFHKVWNSPILKSTKREIQHFWCNAVERFGISSDRHISSSSEEEERVIL